ncbi:unnamed protein product, partial [Oppiella nova]
MDNKAIKELKSDKLKARACNDMKELMNICNCLGRKYLQTNRYNEAIDEHKEELDHSLQMGCRRSEASARRALGECYSEISEYQKALSEHHKYLSLSQSLCDDIEIQRAFATIGRTHYLRAQELYHTNNEVNKKVLMEAKNAFSKALKLCDELTELKDKELAEMRSRLYLNLGLVLEMMGHWKEAMTHLHLSIALNKRFGLTEDMFRCQLALASVYEKNKELQNASNTYDEAIKSAKLLKNRTHLCDALIEKGLVLMRLHAFEVSRKCFKKAYKLNSPIVEDREKVIRYLKIASVICDHFREMSQTSDSEVKLNLCDKLGDHFVELKLFGVAIDFYKKELNLAIQCNKSDAEIAKIYVSIAQTYGDNMQYTEAIEYFTHELNCNRGNGVEESKTLKNIAEMKEYLEDDKLNDDIIETYEMALEKIGNSDTSLSLDLLQRFLAFLRSRRLKCDKILELNDRIKELSLQRRTECEPIEDEEEDNEDIYDKYNLNDLSDFSSGSDDEEVSSSNRSKRMGKKMKTNQLGETDLHRAAIEGKVKLVERLLADKHPVHVRDHCGWTPLHEAVNNGHIEIVKLLLANGAHIDDNEGAKCDGITPLHDACSNGHFSIIRLLLRKGAKVTLLNNSNETPLDSLRDWKRRCSEEKSITENDAKEFKLLEKELEELLNKAGFVRKSVSFPKALNRTAKVHSALIRNRRSSPDMDSDDSLNASIHKSSYSRPNNLVTKSANDMDIDFDDPRTARREYSASISNLRRNRDVDTSKQKPRPKGTAMPALIDERNLVNENQWLIDDMPTNKKRSCLDAFDAFNKRSKTSDNTLKTSKPLRYKSTKQTNIDSQRHDSDLDMYSDSESTCDSGGSEPTVINPKPPLPESTRDMMSKNSVSNAESRTNLKPILLRVCVNDSDNTVFVIPVLNRSANCLWLNKEAEKRYFSKFGEKPILSLQTTDGALLTDEDCILDVITGDELKVNAKIESWVLNPLPD